MGTASTGPAPDRTDSRRTAAVASIVAEFEVVLGRPERVAEACDRLRSSLESPPSPIDLDAALRLASLLARRGDERAGPLFGFLADVAGATTDPWPLLQRMLDARDPGQVDATLDIARRLVADGRLVIDDGILRGLASRFSRDDDASPARRTILDGVAALLRSGTLPIETIFETADDVAVARLAARLLDREDATLDQEAVERRFGPEAAAFLFPLLAYTRAGRVDLVDLAPRGESTPPCLEALREVSRTCGQEALREVLAELGWSRVNGGLETHERVGIARGGGPPVSVAPAETTLFDAARFRRVQESVLLVAHGVAPGAVRTAGAAVPEASRFRLQNLRHAELLAEFLDLAPLDEAHVRRLLAAMDPLVEEHAALFAPYATECGVLPDVYDELRREILESLERERERAQFSPELTRRVQAFEDPRSLAEVRTLHGLKRYLHQSGLRLGARLVERGAATDRTVSIVVIRGGRVHASLRDLAWVDFEPGEDRAALPAGVRIAVDAFARQLEYGRRSFPGLRSFVFGNEVHSFLLFGNHPAFVRVHYAPPASGGMIDLEYFGVSKNELGSHPDPSLDGLRRFLGRLGFDVEISGTRVHVRFDKERAVEIADVVDHASTLFAAAPYLMEIDWVIGGLDLPAGARARVAEAWGEAFAVRHALPLDEVLTDDRRGIVAGFHRGPGGVRPERWSGDGPYRDRWTGAEGRGWIDDVAPRLRALGIDPVLPSGEHGVPFAQFPVERFVLRPFREALARGEIRADREGARRTPGERFVREPESRAFARVLSEGRDAVAQSAEVAAIVRAIEPMLRFRTTGDVCGREVQRARLDIPGRPLGLFVLRDDDGVCRLGLFVEGSDVCFRERKGGTWRSGALRDGRRLAEVLRHADVLPRRSEAGPIGPEQAERLRADLCRTERPRRPPPLPGERIVDGSRAAPGRAVGRAVLDPTGRRPADVAGAILVTPGLRPEDQVYLHFAEGIVSTGGGALSHAGLLAMQVGRPALVVDGEWERDGQGRACVRYRCLGYREVEDRIDGIRATWRADVREREHRLVDGELVALDADDGVLRVLGDDPRALAAHDDLTAIREEASVVAGSTDPTAVLERRGTLLRAQHRLAKLLPRLDDAVVLRHVVTELLQVRDLPGRAALLAIAVSHPALGADLGRHVTAFVESIEARVRSVERRCRTRLPRSGSPYEILSLRLHALDLDDARRAALAVLGEGERRTPPLDGAALDRLTRDRLRALRERWVARLGRRSGLRPEDARHLLEAISIVDEVLGGTSDERGTVACARTRLLREDEIARTDLARRRILDAADGSLEIADLVGAKAANLAEVARICGVERVPSWFAVTDRAFREVLLLPAPRFEEIDLGSRSTLGDAITDVMDRSDLDEKRRSRIVRALWDEVRLPDPLAREIDAAYRRLAVETDPPEGPFVAVRSSGFEEDTAVVARAGEFDTFLFVRGEGAVREHVRKAWAGLWTERAILHRAELGRSVDLAGGGVLVQRMVASRAAGVLYTVDVPRREPRDLVINVGLGLGEGIVSGTVAADTIVVSKDVHPDRGALRFRYVVQDKRDRVVFDERAGQGTVRTDTLYHQRLRPALEYVELCDLVRVALALESVHRRPLDIEFALDETRVWILQVRPVPAYAAAIRRTLEQRPLAAPDGLGEES